MAQTGFTPIQIYSSSTAAAVPTAGNLANSTLGSELAININDGKLFYKDNANVVQVIGWRVVPTSAGGTGLTTYTQGDLLYYNSGTTFSVLNKSTTASRYLSNSGTNNNPSWSQIDLTNGVTGTLAEGNGGTGITSLGTGIPTWLGTPSSANLAAAITDETGSGALVFGTGPTISNLTISGTGGNIYSGVWTPTLTNTTNISASTASEGQYLRVGNTVTVSGVVEIDPTAAGACNMKMTLPISSNFTSLRQAAGTFATVTAGQSDQGSIIANASVDSLEFRFTAVNVANATYAFQATYQIL